MDLHDAGATTVKYLIRDRDSKYTTAFNAVLADSGITTIKTGIRVPRMNAIMERWILWGSNTYRGWSTGLLFCLRQSRA
jgi:transposase InsO family protein